MADYWSNFR